MCTQAARTARTISRVINAALALSICAPVFAGTPFGPALPEQPASQHEPAIQHAPTQAAVSNPHPIDPETTATESKPLDTSGAPAHERIPLGRPAETKPLAVSEESPTWSIVSLQSGASLLFVLGLIVVLKMVLTRAAKSSGSFSARLGAGGRAPSGVLEVLGRYPVARGITLVLLRLDRRVLLLSQSPEGFSTLAELTEPDDIASILTKTRDEDGESISSKFTSMLKRFERDHTIIEEPVYIPESPNADRRAAPLVRAGDISADDIQSHLARIREYQG